MPLFYKGKKVRAMSLNTLIPCDIWVDMDCTRFPTAVSVDEGLTVTSWERKRIREREREREETKKVNVTTQTAPICQVNKNHIREGNIGSKE